MPRFDQIPLDRILRAWGPFGFLISAEVWEWLRLYDLVGPSPPAGKEELPTLRKVVERFNLEVGQNPIARQYLWAGQLHSAGVIVDVLRYIASYYAFHQAPGVLERGLTETGQIAGPEVATRPPASFTTLFPPLPVLRAEQGPEQFLAHLSEVAPNREIMLRELILLWLSSLNPAFKPFTPLYDDAELRRRAPFEALVTTLERFFDRQPPVDPIGATLFKALKQPIEACPDSLDGQLRYIRLHWGHFLPADLLERVYLASDVLREETLLRGFGPGPSEPLRFRTGTQLVDSMYAEPAMFSPDADWMSNVVLIAKSTLVWLYQLSKKYQRDIRTLSDIPDEELDRLARWGFNGLWLIGVWERSPASETIKRITGNPEAAASAYSLYDYIVAGELGGEEALWSLKQRAMARGIRLASDMVPNHMGIYSRWVIEHPQWFLQLPYPPYPNYQYTGTDLSHDPRVCVQIEDGYWDRRDAAVTFRRLDKWTGEARFMYHGNDGTSTPWNDTAQLNFMLPEVREAVIQTILHVARQFSIIRFDAAMTLAKRHFQRLWFPQPGEGGAIPSRAEHSLTRAEFEKLLPKEFWREVVDRVAAEVPDTLLLAEAFWLMEGYFVRTLGMHRVYNSAFMNMLKMEDNQNYRLTMKNVLEFSPEVLKRFVNFMNNPDERTAVEQFGKADKYFGVAMMMVTLPGLPMFGHGQIEGWTEKYGMEYRRSYWEEPEDAEMIANHEKLIFPLMKKRWLYSGVEHFALYDFVTPQGWVDENVFAYSNRCGSERAVILYHNAYQNSSGAIHTSSPLNFGSSELPSMVRKSLVDSLGLDPRPGHFYLFRDQPTGLEYVRSGADIAEHGLFAELRGYQWHAFIDWQERFDHDGSWYRLAVQLKGSGVPSIETAYREMILEPLLSPLRHLLGYLGNLDHAPAKSIAELEPLIRGFADSVQQFAGVSGPVDELVATALRTLTLTHQVLTASGKRASAAVLTDASVRRMLLFWSVFRVAGAGEMPIQDSAMVAKRLADWRIRPACEQTLASGPEPTRAGTEALAAVLLTQLSAEPAGELFDSAWWKRHATDTLLSEWLQLNHWDNRVWLSKERLEQLAELIALATQIQVELAELSQSSRKKMLERLDQFVTAAAAAGYDFDETVRRAAVPKAEPRKT